MPTAFTTIQEAEKYHAVIFSLGQCDLPDSSSDKTAPQHHPTIARLEIGNFEGNSSARNGELKFLLKHILRWLAAYTMMPQQLLDQRRHRALLKMQMISFYTFLATSTSASQMIYDDYLPRFKELVELLEYILDVGNDSAPRNSRFYFNGDTIVSNYMVGMKCREPSFRRRAASLLISRARIEVVWDSILAGKIVKWAIQVEEEFIKEGVVPRWARISGVAVDYGSQARTATFSCQQRISSSSEELVTRQ
jgi:hypothetical protein